MDEALVFDNLTLGGVAIFGGVILVQALQQSDISPQINQSQGACLLYLTPKSKVRQVALALVCSAVGPFPG